jgi:hypothetical protein
LEAGAVHEIEADVMPAVPVTPVGAPGANAVTVAGGDEALELPAPFVAYTTTV